MCFTRLPSLPSAAEGGDAGGRNEGGTRDDVRRDIMAVRVPTVLCVLGARLPVRSRVGACWQRTALLPLPPASAAHLPPLQTGTCPVDTVHTPFCPAPPALLCPLWPPRCARQPFARHPLPASALPLPARAAAVAVTQLHQSRRTCVVGWQHGCREASVHNLMEWNAEDLCRGCRGLQRLVQRRVAK